MSQVIRLDDLRAIIFNAWADFRASVWTPSYSACIGLNPGEAKRQFGFVRPHIEGGTWWNAAGTWSENNELGAWLQNAIAGPGFRPLWVDVGQVPHGLDVRGPFDKQLSELIIEYATQRALRQTKGRQSGVWVGKDGERNRLLLRVPHR